jgi:hypothetical protein
VKLEWRYGTGTGWVHNGLFSKVLGCFENRSYGSVFRVP